jgi:hypothetical protein
VTVGVDLIAYAAIAAAAASAAMQYKSTSDQSKVNEYQARIKSDQARLQASQVLLQAKEGEVARQRRAGLAESNLRATAAEAGIDPFASGSVRSLAGENERLVGADLTNIRMLGAAGAGRALVEGRGYDALAAQAAAAGDNAWIAPTLNFMQSAFSTAGSAGWLKGTPNPSSPGVAPGAKEPLTGRIAGPI